MQRAPSAPRYHDKEALWQHMVSKHSYDTAIEVPKGPLMEAESTFNGGDSETDFVPCEVCAQAVPTIWHMDQHLEMLKPICGMKALCKVCGRTFIEHRALRQHLNFCRLKVSDGKLMVRDPNQLQVKAVAEVAEVAEVAGPAGGLPIDPAPVTGAPVGKAVVGTRVAWV